MSLSSQEALKCQMRSGRIHLAAHRTRCPQLPSSDHKHHLVQVRLGLRKAESDALSQRACQRSS
eukprot:1071389-Rhodomonas_salina.3